MIERLRPRLAYLPSGHLFVVPASDLYLGGRTSNAQYQYTLLSDGAETLYEWTPKLVDALEHNAVLADVSSDQQQRGLETFLDHRSRQTARLGITPQQIDNSLYDAFGQRQVSVIYSCQKPVSRRHGDRSTLAQFPDALSRRLRMRLRPHHPLVQRIKRAGRYCHVGGDSHALLDASDLAVVSHFYAPPTDNCARDRRGQLPTIMRHAIP